MVLCGFLFDAVVISVNLQEGPVESVEELSVDLTFGEFSARITPSRINVIDFPENKSLEFEEDTDNIRNILEVSPLNLSLSYFEEAIGKHFNIIKLKHTPTYAFEY